MGKYKDLTGQIFGDWTVLEYSHGDGTHSYWICKCSCRKQTIRTVRADRLTGGTSKSCGHRIGTPYRVEGDVAIFTTRNNEEFFTDVEDAERVSVFTWEIDSPRDYVVSKIKDKRVYLHHFIIPNRTLEMIDHIDRNKRNNTKANLREATRSNNMHNAIFNPGAHSKYKGVTLCKRNNKWYARISCHPHTYHLGYYEKEIDAAKAYNDAAIELCGEFALINDLSAKENGNGV